MSNYIEQIQFLHFSGASFVICVLCMVCGSLTAPRPPSFSHTFVAVLMQSLQYSNLAEGTNAVPENPKTFVDSGDVGIELVDEPLDDEAIPDGATKSREFDHREPSNAGSRRNIRILFAAAVPLVTV